MTYRSNNPIERIRKLLLNYDLEIERVKSEIAIRKENMAFYGNSARKEYLKKFAVAKVEKENYEVFLNRLNEQKNNLLKRLSVVADKYEGGYSKIFYMFFFEQRPYKEISLETGISEENIQRIVSKMRQDIIEYKL